MQIRTATSADLAAVVQIEAECFPAAEAATELSLARRLALYPNHFWVLMDGKQLAQSLLGPKILSQNRPSFSGFSVL